MREASVIAEDDVRSIEKITAPAARATGRMDPRATDAVLAFIDGPPTDDPTRVTRPLTGALEPKSSGYPGFPSPVCWRGRPHRGSHRAAVQLEAAQPDESPVSEPVVGITIPVPATARDAAREVATSGIAPRALVWTDQLHRIGWMSKGG